MNFFANFKINQFKIFSWFIIPLPLLSLTGPALPDIFISVVGLYFLVTSIFYKNYFYYKNYFFILFIIFCFYLILRSILSKFPLLSITTEGSMFYFRYIFFSLGVWHIYKNYPNLVKYLAYSILIVVSIAILDGYLQFFSGENIFGWKSAWEGMRLSGFFNDELILGSYVTKYAPLGVAFFLIANKELSKKNFILLISFLMIAEILAFISGERAAFFHITLFTIIVIILSRRFWFFRLLSFLISCCIIFLLFSNNNALQERSSKTIEQVSSVKIKYLPYSPGHEKIYITALKMFINNPFFGEGTNLFRHLCKDPVYYLDDKPECHSQPHNMYIQLLAETGLIGFMFVFSWFLFLSYKLFKHFVSLYLLSQKKWRLDDGILFIYIFSFVIWWPLIPHQSFFNSWTNVMLFLPVGFILNDLHNNKS